LARVQRQRNVVGDDDAAELLAEVFEAQDLAHQCATPASRRPTSPCGRTKRKRMTSTVKMMPCNGPTRLDGSCMKVIACGNATSTKAPISGPQVVPIPPSTTIVRIVADCATLNCSGLMYWK